MASKAYSEWVAAGRPLEPCQPVREFVELMRIAFPRAADQHQFSWYANEEHYQANPPLDHTPFSATGWPLPSPRWVVNATDIMHRPDLGVDCHILFQYWIGEARAGRMPWLKYIIWQGKLYHSRTGFMVAEDNEGHFDHIHLSFRTDYRYASLGSWSPVPGKDKPMRTMLVTGNGGDGKVWLGNGVIRRHVADLTEEDKATGDAIVLRDTQWVAGPSMLGSLTSPTVQKVDDLDAFGAEYPSDFADRFRALETTVAALAGGDIDPVKLAAAMKAAMLDPDVLAANAKAVADEDHRRSAS